MQRSAASAPPDRLALAAGLGELLEGRHLSPSQRRVARFLLDHPQDSVFLSATDIAQRVGVSQPSVTRFAAALGFRGYPEFREALRAGILDGRRPSQEPTANDLQQLVTSEIRDLEALRDSVADSTRIGEIAGVLAGSTPLPVLGLRVSAPVAHLFGYLAAKVLPDVRVLDAPGSLLEDHLARARDAGATTLLAFGLPRYPRELATGLHRARELGLGVVLVTDSPLSPLTELADHVLVAPVSSYSAFDSHAAPTVLCTALVHAVLGALGPEGQRRLEAFDDSAAERDLFLPA